MQAEVEAMLQAADEKLVELEDEQAQAELLMVIERAQRQYSDGDYEAARSTLDAVVPRPAGGLAGALGLPELSDLQSMYLGGAVLAIFMFVVALAIAFGGRAGPPAIAVRAPRPLPPGRRGAQAKRIGIVSTAMFTGSLMGLVGLVPGILYGFLTYLVGEVIGSIGGMKGIGSALGMLSIVGFPLLFGILGAIGGAVLAVAYDLAAGLGGGVRLELEGKRLRRIGAVSLAVHLGVMLGLVTLGPGLLFFALRGGLLAERTFAIAFIGVVVASAVGGALAGLAAALGHNLLARLSGGVELELAERRLKRLGVWSMAKLSATACALAGLVQGVLLAAVGTLFGPSLDALLGSPGTAQGLGLAAVAVLPIAAAILGALAGVAQALVLDLALFLCGGLVLDLGT